MTCVINCAPACARLCTAAIRISVLCCFTAARQVELQNYHVFTCSLSWATCCVLLDDLETWNAVPERLACAPRFVSGAYGGVNTRATNKRARTFILAARTRDPRYSVRPPVPDGYCVRHSSALESFSRTNRTVCSHSTALYAVFVFFSLRLFRTASFWAGADWVRPRKRSVIDTCRRVTNARTRLRLAFSRYSDAGDSTFR